MPDYTPHQKRIIDGYYKNRDEIMLTRLQEITTELCLAESDAALERLWTRADKAMRTLKIPKSVVEHILAKRDPQILARNLRKWLADAGAKRRGDQAR
jgi:hypothetical protein